MVPPTNISSLMWLRCQ